VPFRKFALKIVKIMIRLLMRKNEEYVSNKKRFMDAFGPAGDDDFDASVKKQKRDENEEEESKEATIKDEDFYFLFSGNTDDHFKMGLSVSKKSLKLFTEFYSSDIIIASPLGLRSVIDGDGFVFISFHKLKLFEFFQKGCIRLYGSGYNPEIRVFVIDLHVFYVK
jgi:U3 small nucleolar RNA-associated protein 25